MLSTTATGIAAVMSVYLTVQVSFHGIKHKQRSQVEKPDLAKELDIKLAKMKKNLASLMSLIFGSISTLNLRRLLHFSV